MILTRWGVWAGVVFVGVLLGQGAGAYSNANLPWMLQFLNGTIVETPAQWEARKAEMRMLLETWYYGTFPTEAPPAVRSATRLNSTLVAGTADEWWFVDFEPLNGVSTNITLELLLPVGCTSSVRGEGAAG